jgi:hypothetical protein
MPETNGTRAPMFEPEDDGDFGGDPDVGAGIGSGPSVTEPSVIEPWVTEPPSMNVGSEPGDSARPQGWFTYHVCVALKQSCSDVRSAFCVSQPDGAVRGRCRSHVYDSSVSWQNYCYNEFNAE